MLSLFFPPCFLFKPVSEEALAAPCASSKCLSERALRTHLMLLDIQWLRQSCCYNPRAARRSRASNPPIPFGPDFQVRREAQLNL